MTPHDVVLYIFALLRRPADDDAMSLYHSLRFVFAWITALFVCALLFCLCVNRCFVCVCVTVLFACELLFCLRVSHCFVCVCVAVLFWTDCAVCNLHIHFTQEQTGCFAFYGRKIDPAN